MLLGWTGSSSVVCFLACPASGLLRSFFSSAFHHREIVRDLGDLAEHDRRRAVFLGGEFHRLFDPFWIQPFAGDGEVDMDSREHLGVGVGPGGVEVDHAVGDRLATLAQDVDDVEGGAAAQSQ